jgi:hypothetical protein
MAERLLFLDFDGVLHPNHCAEEVYFSRMPLLMNFLHSVDRDLGVVISSSWRHHHTYEELLAFLPEPASRRIVGATGAAFIGKYARYQEIRAFLADYRGWLDWRALDDSAWEFPEQCPELIRCDGAIGITEREMGGLSEWVQSAINRESSC